MQNDLTQTVTITETDRAMAFHPGETDAEFLTRKLALRQQRDLARMTSAEDIRNAVAGPFAGSDQSVHDFAERQIAVLDAQ